MASAGYFVAAKPIPVMRDGRKVIVPMGEHVPEADKWHNPKGWEDQGWIRWMPGKPVEGTKAAKAPEAPRAKAKDVDTTQPSEVPAVMAAVDAAEERKKLDADEPKAKKGRGRKKG